MFSGGRLCATPPCRLLSALSALNSVSSSFVFEAESFPQCPASRLCLRVAPDRGSRSPLLAALPVPPPPLLMRGLAVPALRQLLSLRPQRFLCARPSPHLCTYLSVSTQRFFVIRRSDLSLLQQLLRLDQIRTALRIMHVSCVCGCVVIVLLLLWA